MRIAKIILGLLLFALLWIPGAAKADTFTADEQVALDRGEIGQGAVLALFSGAIQNGLLGVPANVRDWVQGPNGSRYRGDGTATATTQ